MTPKAIYNIASVHLSNLFLYHLTCYSSYNNLFDASWIHLAYLYFNICIFCSSEIFFTSTYFTSVPCLFIFTIYMFFVSLCLLSASFPWKNGPWPGPWRGLVPHSHCFPESSIPGTQWCSVNNCVNEPSKDDQRKAPARFFERLL